MMNERGSIWRKWDLHVHTPASFQWSGRQFRDMNPDEEKRAIGEILQAMESTDVSVFGIMDYWDFDGYLKLRKYIAENKPDFSKVILPGIELRVSSPTNFRLNFHFILSEKLSDQQLRDFRYHLQIDCGGVNRPLSDEALIELGARQLPDVALKHGFVGDRSERDNLKFGSMIAEISKECLKKAIECVGKHNVLVMMPYDTSDGLEDLDWVKHPMANSFFSELADMFETRKEENIQLFNGIRTERNKSYIDNFIGSIGGIPKPCVSGSDAHNPGRYGDFPNNRITWIKADPTFRGLRQIINEPVDRVYIGLNPQKRKKVEEEPSRFVKSIAFRKKAHSSNIPDYFNCVLELNYDLVAIIGNKGSGKSILADSLAISLNTHRSESVFSALNNKKFKHPKKNTASHYDIVTISRSGFPSVVAMNTEADKDKLEKVRYIPQSFLEQICNDVDNSIEFEKEIKRVIFSHVAEEDKLRQGDLDAVINKRVSAYYERIESLRNDIRITNRNIVELKEQVTDANKARLRSQIEAINAMILDVDTNLQNLHSVKPINPSEDSEIEKRNNELLQEIKTHQDEIDRISKTLESAQKELVSLKIEKTEIEELHKRAESFINQHTRFIVSNSKIADKFGIELALNFQLSANLKPMLDKINSIDERIRDCELEIVGREDLNFENRVKELKAEIEVLNLKLSEPQKKYREYLERVEDLNKQKLILIGDSLSFGSLSYYKTAFENLNKIPAAIQILERDRDVYVREIITEFNEIIKIYKSYFDPVDEFIRRSFDKESFGEINKILKLQFEAKLIEKGFSDTFLSYINKRRKGSFYGTLEAEEYLNNIIKSIDFNNDNEIIEFTRRIIRALERHAITNEPLSVPSQLKIEDNYSILLDYVFCLEYLHPSYSLTSDGKPLSTLSPGERGILLLVFYLLIDNEDIPIIIDQPEENLDNQTIYGVLVPCIKEAKQSRQIFIVTHNPNLAVVCDAEQVIFAKKENDCFTYKSGSIEDIEIGKVILDILEGTKFAFDNRDAKYKITQLGQ